MHIFWKNVERILQYREINMKTLAARAGVPYSTITNGKNGNGSPSIDTAFKIAGALDVSVEQLMGAKARRKNDTLYVKNAPTETGVALFRRYKNVIDALEKLPVELRESIVNLTLRMAEEKGEERADGKKRRPSLPIYRIEN